MFKILKSKIANVELIRASKHGKLEGVISALKKGANVNYKSNKALRNAVKNGNIEIVEYLLSSSDLKVHADISVMSEEPLNEAIENNHLEIVKYLISSKEIKKHANPNSNNYWALKQAAEKGNVEILSILLKSKDIHFSKNANEVKNDILAHAAKKNNMNILKYLFRINFIDTININLQKIQQNCNSEIYDFIENYKNSQIEKTSLGKLQNLSLNNTRKKLL